MIQTVNTSVIRKFAYTRKSFLGMLGRCSWVRIPIVALVNCAGYNQQRRTIISQDQSRRSIDLWLVKNWTVTTRRALIVMRALMSPYKWSLCLFCKYYQDDCYPKTPSPGQDNGCLTQSRILVWWDQYLSRWYGITHGKLPQIKLSAECWQGAGHHNPQ